MRLPLRMMNRARFVRLCVAATMLLTATNLAWTARANADVDKRPMVRRIVAVRAGVDPAIAGQRAAQTLNGRLLHVYRQVFHGYNVAIPVRVAKRLAKLPFVAAVYDDVDRAVYRALAPYADVHGAPMPGPQVVPTGVSRVNGPLSSTRSGDGDGVVDVDIAILDSGLDETHSDLNVVGGVNCTTSMRAALEGKPSWHDLDGHGTEVAGLAAARDNSFGVVGTAPGARLWAVKVLHYITQDLPGQRVETDAGVPVVSYLGLFDGNLLCGLEWVAAHSAVIEVANMSVRTTSDDSLEPCNGKYDGAPLTQFTMPFVGNRLDQMHEAVCAVAARGVTMVAAAGNEAQNVNEVRAIPALFPEVIAVSGMADTDGRPGGADGVQFVGHCPNALFPPIAKVVPAPVYPRVRRTVRPLGERLNGVPYSTLEYEIDDTFTNFSNFGAAIDLTAPANCQLTTHLDNKYGLVSGTSDSTPLVTGAAALYRSTHPAASPSEVRAALVERGSMDWDDRDDPDSTKEPLLDVRTL